ncbi:ribosome silencing factor [Sphingomicrobium nitratireducens]|uniref:ribosome silencing factor n=1 Tax=Sphingomicrobium nitratireducens TaxID=2964666 RepID=UPI003B84582F
MASTLRRCARASREGVTLAQTDTAPAGTTARPPADAQSIENLHQLVLQSLDDDQAVEVVTIPLAGKSTIADHMVIASGRSTRQVAAIAQKLAERVKKETGRPVRVEGLPTADWVLIDIGDVVVHLFRPEVRSFYNLERMWAFDDEAAPAPAGTA